jgi:hypothetical protein
MPGKGANFGSKTINALAAAAAAFIVRKAISLVWTKATGRQPPDAPEDPQVAVGEAVAWAAVVGVGVGVARVLAIRLASRQMQRQLNGSADVEPGRHEAVG